MPKSEIYNQNEVVKCPDGSIIYYKSYNDMTPEEVNSLAAENCVYGIPRVCEYDSISRDTVEKFEKFIEYLQNKGIKVIFFLPSFHSYYIDYVINTGDKYRSLWQTEEIIRNLGEKYGIEVYGSYDGKNCDISDRYFMDGIHMNKNGLRKVLPLIE